MEQYPLERTWTILDLENRFGESRVLHLMNEGILKRQHFHNARLAFEVFGQPSEIILKTVREEISSFSELMEKLEKPYRTKWILKNNLSFLCNFKQVQCIISPATGLTYIALEGEEISEIYENADLVESHFQYQINPDETAAEFRESFDSYL